MTRENLRERKVWGQRNREKMGREAQAEGETLKKKFIKLPLISCEDVTYRLHLMWLVITINGHLFFVGRQILTDMY